jgi:hypothetical protein
MILSWFQRRAGQPFVTISPELAGYAVDNSRRKVQNVLTDSSAVGLGRGSPQRLDHQDLLTPLILLKPLNQPVVKAADFDHGNVLLAGGLQLLPKLRQLGPPCADLAAQQNITFLIAKRDSHLLPMKIDSEVQHIPSSWKRHDTRGSSIRQTSPTGSPFDSRRNQLSPL